MWYKYKYLGQASADDPSAMGGALMRSFQFVDIPFTKKATQIFFTKTWGKGDAVITFLLILARQSSDLSSALLSRMDCATPLADTTTTTGSPLLALDPDTHMSSSPGQTNVLVCHATEHKRPEEAIPTYTGYFGHAIYFDRQNCE